MRRLAAIREPQMPIITIIISKHMQFQVPLSLNKSRHCLPSFVIYNFNNTFRHHKIHPSVSPQRMFSHKNCGQIKCLSANLWKQSIYTISNKSQHPIKSDPEKCNWLALLFFGTHTHTQEESTNNVVLALSIHSSTALHTGGQAGQSTTNWPFVLALALSYIF